MPRDVVKSTSTKKTFEAWRILYPVRKPAEIEPLSATSTLRFLVGRARLITGKFSQTLERRRNKFVARTRRRPRSPIRITEKVRIRGEFRQQIMTIVANERKKAHYPAFYYPHFVFQRFLFFFFLMPFVSEVICECEYVGTRIPLMNFFPYRFGRSFWFFRFSLRDSVSVAAVSLQKILHSIYTLRFSDVHLSATFGAENVFGHFDNIFQNYGENELYEAGDYSQKNGTAI